MGKEKLPPEVLEYFKRQGSKGGKLGGSKAWENLSPEERSARAKRAVAAREIFGDREQVGVHVE